MSTRLNWFVLMKGSKNDLCDLKQYLAHAQLKVIENSSTAADVYLNYVQDLVKVSRAFRGTGLPRVSVKN